MKNNQELETVDLQVNYSLENGDKISCKEVLAAHSVIADEVKETEGKSLNKSLAEVEKLIGNHGYEFYVSFEIDENTTDILDLVLISKFILNPPCYSTRLFRCIAKENNLDKDATFVFFNAEIGGEKKVVIKVGDDNEVALYDMSKVPF